MDRIEFWERGAEGLEKQRKAKGGSERGFCGEKGGSSNRRWVVCKVR